MPPNCHIGVVLRLLELHSHHCCDHLTGGSALVHWEIGFVGWGLLSQLSLTPTVHTLLLPSAAYACLKNILEWVIHIELHVTNDICLSMQTACD